MLVIFASAGDTPLSWQMKITNNPEGLDWVVAPPSGNLSECDIGNVSLTLNAVSLHARPEAYVTNFTVLSNSLSKDSQSITVMVRAFVNADVDATESEVYVLHADQTVASTEVHFHVAPRDAMGLFISSSQLTFSAKLTHASAINSYVVCFIYFKKHDKDEDQIWDGYYGVCDLPGGALAGNFYINVSTSATDGYQLIGGRPQKFRVELCPVGFYWDVSLDQCVTCPNHATCPNGTTKATLDVDQGYWRVNQDSLKFTECIYAKSCRGGHYTETQCAAGSTGPICAVCDPGYFMASDHACEKCSEDNRPVRRITILVLTMWFGFAAFMFLRIRRRLRLTNQTHLWTQFERKLSIRCKFAFINYQIINRFVKNIDVPWPERFQAFLSGFSVFDLDISRLMAWGCFGEPDFHAELLVTTLVPTTMLIILLTLNNAVPRFRGRFATPALVLTYVCFPTVSSKIFQTFDCDARFEDAEGNPQRFLRADYGIDCDSDAHRPYFVWACCAVVLFPVGVPCAYAWLLVTNRNKINPPLENPSALLASLERRTMLATNLEIMAGPSVVDPNGSLPPLPPALAAQRDEESVSFEMTVAKLEPLLVALAEVKNNPAIDQSLAQVKLHVSLARGEIASILRSSDASIANLRFLYSAYQPRCTAVVRLACQSCGMILLRQTVPRRCWYSELIETSRRIVLTEVLTVVAPGTLTQVVMGFLVSVSYAILSVRLKPFLEEDDDQFANWGHLVVTAIAFQAILLRASPEAPLDWCLVALHGSITCMLVVQLCVAWPRGLREALLAKAPARRRRAIVVRASTALARLTSGIRSHASSSVSSCNGAAPADNPLRDDVNENPRGAADLDDVPTQWPNGLFGPSPKLSPNDATAQESKDNADGIASSFNDQGGTCHGSVELQMFSGHASATANHGSRGGDDRADSAAPFDDTGRVSEGTPHFRLSNPMRSGRFEVAQRAPISGGKSVRIAAGHSERIISHHHANHSAAAAVFARASLRRQSNFPSPRPQPPPPQSEPPPLARDDTEGSAAAAMDADASAPDESAAPAEPRRTNDVITNTDRFVM